MARTPTARFTFFAGKGGVGKTTCAAAAAVAAAEEGADVLVLSTDPAHSLGDALDVPLGPRPRRIPGRGRLTGVEIDAPAGFRRFLSRRRQKLAAIVERGTYLDREDVDRFVALSLPGVDELIALLEMSRLARAGGHDLVVVDTAPTGHTLRLLAMPALLSRVAELLDDLSAKHRFLARSLGGRYRPDATDALVRELDAEARALGELLRDPERTTFVWVTLPETLAVEETKDGVAALARDGIGVAEIVVNRTTPPAPGRCGLCEGRRRAEAQATAALQAALPRLRLHAVAALETEPRGRRWLRQVARAMRAKPRAVKPARRTAATARDRGPGSFTADAHAWLDRLLPPEPRLVLFAGKGGVGKTTCAATTALAAAARHPDRRWLLLSADPAHSLGDALDIPIGDDGRRLAPGLQAREMDATRALEERRRRYRRAVEDLFTAVGAKGGAGATFDQRAVEDLIELAPPGIDEVLAVLSVIEALFREDGPSPYDGVIVDAAPTGHALRLLAMPELALEWAQAILAVLLKYREVARLGALAQELVTTSRGLRRLRDLLRDGQRCAVVAVTRAGELPRRETVRLLGSLKRQGIPVSAVVVNALTPAGCARCRRAARREKSDVRALASSMPRRLPLLGTPAVAPPPRGAAALSRWARTWNTIESDA